MSMNSEKHIQRAISSLESQTFKDFEVVFIDAVSKDKTLDIINASNLNKVVISEKDKGIYDAMNKGVNNSSGEVIYFLNTDDYVSNEFVFEKAMKAFKEDTALMHGSTSVHRDGKTIDYFFKFNIDNLVAGKFPAQQCIFYSKDMLKELGLFNIKYRLAADFDMLCRINVFVKEHECSVVELPFSIGYLTPGGASAVGNLGEIELSSVIREYYGDIPYVCWLFPKRIKTFFRNILAKTNTLEWYRTNISKKRGI